jgi:hypothetical protein
MTVVICITENNKLIASYGVNSKTMENICLPPEHPSFLGAIYDHNINEWVIK